MTTIRPAYRALKIAKWITIVITGLILTIIITLGGLYVSDPLLVYKKELLSPNQSKRLVLVIRDGGATTSRVFSLYVFNKKPELFEGLKISLSRPLFTADHFSVVDFTWASDSKIVISHSGLRIFRKRNTSEVSLQLNERLS